MARIHQSGTFTLGDSKVRRLGYGAMQLAGPGVSGRPRIVTRQSPCCVKLWRLASTTSTPVIFTDLTSPTK